MLNSSEGLCLVKCYFVLIHAHIPKLWIFDVWSYKITNVFYVELCAYALRIYNCWHQDKNKCNLQKKHTFTRTRYIMFHFLFSISEAHKNNVNNVTVFYGVVGGGGSACVSLHFVPQSLCGSRWYVWTSSIHHLNSVSSPIFMQGLTLFNMLTVRKTDYDEAC